MKRAPHFLVGVTLLLGMTLLLRYASHVESFPPRPSFAEFPLRIGERWQGRELGLEQAVLDVLRVDDYMMRLYQSPRGEPAWLYVGYYKTQRTGATYHSPLNCLPGAGWTIESRDIVPIAVDGRAVQVNRVLIQKGLDRQVILYWYQDRGRIIADEYRAKGYLVLDAMTRNRTDGALVRISVPVAGSSERAFAAGVEFLQAAWPALSRHLPG